MMVHEDVFFERDSRRLISMLLDDGWNEIGVTGSHRHLKHPNKPGKVTLLHPTTDLPASTACAMLKHAGLLK